MHINTPNFRTIAGGAAIAAVLAVGATAAVSADRGAQHGAATILDASGDAIGFATFVEDGDGTVHVNVKVEGLSTGLHGVHIHEIGSCSSTNGTFSGAGAHHRALGTHHPDHYGDLPNLVVNDAGRGRLATATDRPSLTAGEATIFDGNGSAIVVHAMEDRFDTVNFGGPRVACGVIEPG